MCNEKFTKLESHYNGQMWRVDRILQTCSASIPLDSLFFYKSAFIFYLVFVLSHVSLHIRSIHSFMK